jgi:hypothetical protein
MLHINSFWLALTKHLGMDATDAHFDRFFEVNTWVQVINIREDLVLGKAHYKVVINASRRKRGVVSTKAEEDLLAHFLALEAPFSPTSPCTSPGRNSRSTFRTGVRTGKALANAHRPGGRLSESTALCHSIHLLIHNPLRRIDAGMTHTKPLSFYVKSLITLAH